MVRGLQSKTVTIRDCNSNRCYSNRSPLIDEGREGGGAAATKEQNCTPLPPPRAARDAGWESFLRSPAHDRELFQSKKL